MNPIFTRKKRFSLFTVLGMGALLLFMLFSGPVAGQIRHVTGTIVDEQGNPIHGASVMVDGTSTTAITDSRGNFSITASPNSVLKVSYVGYLTQTVSNLESPRVVLKEDTMNLDEIVVVGYSTQSMRNVTGAVATINPEDVKDLPVLNLGASLRGQIPGVNVSGGTDRPGNTATITLRQDDTPLFIIDDVVYNMNKSDGVSAFNNLDPNMIESITVLKDASAAVYGTNAGDGAIIVKTKRGQRGETKISYSGFYAVTDKLTSPKMMNAYDYAVTYNRMVAPSQEAYDKLSNKVTGLYQNDELEAMKKMDYDWLGKAWSSSYSMRHNVNISGGSDKATYFGAISYSEQDGNLFTERYNRWNFRAGIDATVAKNLKASISVSGDYSEKEMTLSKAGGTNDNNDYNTLFQTPRHHPWSMAAEDGTEYWVARHGFGSGYNNYHYYAIESLSNRKLNEDSNMVLNASLNYDFNWSRILRGLTMRGTYSRTFNNYFYDEFGTRFDLLTFKTKGGSGGHLLTDGGQYLENYGGRLMDPNNMTVVSIENGNQMLKDFSKTVAYQANFFVTYNRSFGNHNVSGLFTIERAEREYRYMRVNKKDVTPDYTGELDAAKGDPNATSTRLTSGSLSYVGRINYSYADKYLFEFLIRTDASTKFAPENYWGTFPSFSAGWVMSEENWFKPSLPWVDFLKIRASYGIVGKDDTDAWAWLQKFTYQHDKGPVLGGDNVRNPGLETGSAPNRDAHWSHTYKHNIGLDTRFLKGRLSLGLDAYYDRRRDQFRSRSATMPLSTGAALSKENFQNDDVWGGEISIGWRDKIGEVGYSIRANTSWKGAGKALFRDWPQTYKLPDVRPNGPLDTGTWGYDAEGILRTWEDVDAYIEKYQLEKYFGSDAKTVLKPGMVAYRDIRSAQRVEGTNDQFIEDPDRQITEEDRLQLAKPVKIGGFNMNLGADWKGITLTAQISASWGGYQQIGQMPSATPYENYPIYWKDIYQAELDLGGTDVYIPANINGKYPSTVLSNTKEVSSIWKIPSFRMYLRSLTIGYNVPKALLDKVNVSSCRLTLTGNNLFSFYNPLPKKYMDPLGSYTGYPTLRSLSLGVNIGF